MPKTYKYDIFLSHNKKDKSAVRQLAQRLKQSGLRVWFDEWVIQPGDDIFLRIEQGLQDSRTLILCMTQSAFESDWVSLERSTVLFRDPANKNRRFIPLLMEDCEIPDTIRRYAFVDFRENEAYEKLVSACKPEIQTQKPEIEKEQKPIAKFERKLEGHDSWIQSVAVSPDGKWAVSGSCDKTVKIWNLETGKCRVTLEGHTDIVSSIAIIPDGKRILSASFDKTIRIWDVRTGQQLAILKGHLQAIKGITVLSGGHKALTGSWDNTLKLWNINSKRCIKTYSGHTDIIFCVAVTTDEKMAVSGDQKGEIKVWDLQTGECLQTLTGHTMAVTSVQITSDGRYVVSGSCNMTVKLWDLKTGNCIWSYEENLYDIYDYDYHTYSGAISPDETLIASTGFKDDTLQLWDLKSGSCVQIIHRGKNISLHSVAFSPDRSRIVTGTTGTIGWIKSPIYVYRLTGIKPASIPEIAQPWTATPRLLNELKNAVMRMKENGNVRLLRFPELLQRLEQALPDHNFDESDARTAVTLLANHGLVMPFKFGDLVLLQPEILNGYASAIIRSARSHTDEIGCVSEQDVFAGKIDFTGVDRLVPSDEELLLRAMVQTFLDKSLCMSEDTPQGRQLIFPSQYRRERDIPAHPEIFVSYTFSGEPATIYTTLVVRLWYSREFDNKELWCNAAEFITITQRTAGFVMKRIGEGQAAISVFFDTLVPEELKVVFIEYVHQHLQKYAQEVCRERRYVCQCGKAVKDAEAVRKRLSSGKDFIYCQECDEQIPLIDHIEKRLASDPVAQRIIRMEQTASRELDTQALEQILTGHLMAICGEANQIFKVISIISEFITGEIEFKDNNGKPSGKKISVFLLKKSYKDSDKTHRKYVIELDSGFRRNDESGWLVIRDAEDTIRWMNITEYLKIPKKQKIVFEGGKLDAPALWNERDRHISPRSHTEEVLKEIIITALKQKSVEVHINGNVSGSIINAGDENAINSQK